MGTWHVFKPLNCQYSSSSHLIWSCVDYQSVKLDMDQRMVKFIVYTDVL